MARVGRHEDWRIADLLMAYSSIVYGLWLLLPMSTLDGTPYTYVAAIGLPEWFWGLLFFGTGALRALGGHRRRHGLRKATALVGLMKWALWWMALMMGAPTGALASLFLVLAVGSALSYLAALDCEVIGGRCNGLLEHRVGVLAETLSQRRRRSEPP